MFDAANKLCELKGFEIKRRGELEIIKIFQEQVFPQFLSGETKPEAYAAAAAVGNRWYVQRGRVVFGGILSPVDPEFHSLFV